MALSEKDKKGALLIGLVVVALVAVVTVKLAIGTPAKPDSDGCIGKVVANTVVVLDHSEKLAEQTIREISARTLAHVVSKAQVNERVTVFNVSDHSRKALVPIFSRCKPAQEGNRAIEDTRGIAKAYSQKFLEPLQAVLKTVPVDAKESPIAQALIDISLTQYLRGERNSLLVFSDMLENTPKFSMYDTMHDCADAKQSVARFRESRKGAEERPKFRHTGVWLHMIPRIQISKPTLRCREAVWAWFFGDNEGAGASVDTDYLPGA